MSYTKQGASERRLIQQMPYVQSLKTCETEIVEVVIENTASGGGKRGSPG